MVLFSAHKKLSSHLFDSPSVCWNLNETCKRKVKMSTYKRKERKFKNKLLSLYKWALTNTHEPHTTSTVSTVQP